MLRFLLTLCSPLTLMHVHALESVEASADDERAGGGREHQAEPSVSQTVVLEPIA